MPPRPGTNGVVIKLLLGVRLPERGILDRDVRHRGSLILEWFFFPLQVAGDLTSHCRPFTIIGYAEPLGQRCAGVDHGMNQLALESECLVAVFVFDDVDLGCHGVWFHAPVPGFHCHAQTSPGVVTESYRDGDTRHGHHLGDFHCLAHILRGQLHGPQGLLDGQGIGGFLFYRRNHH